MNLIQMLRNAVEHYGRKVAIIFGKRRLSYAELEEASDKIANTLMKSGVSNGDRVVILLPNCPEFVVAYFGVIKTGGTAVPLDTKYKAKELASVFDNCRPKVLVTDDPFLEPLVSILPRFKYLEHVISLGSKYRGNFLSYKEIMAKKLSRTVETKVEPQDIAHIAYTSGPTFRPKGVMLSHKDLVTAAVLSGDAFQQDDKDITALFALPLHHAYGLVVVLLGSLAKGGTVAIMPGLSISSLTELIEKERATIFMGVPFIFDLISRFAEEEGLERDLSSLRLCVSAGAPLPTAIVERFKKYYGLNIIEFWGLTEAVGCVTSQPIEGNGKLSSVGRALPGYTVKVVNEEGRELSTGQAGEVIVSGLAMKGYFGNPEATAVAIRRGWLYTGDIGKFDDDGDLFLVGRKKEMILTKGQNIYPVDIEDVLNAHPKVAEAAVVGVPDETRGEVARAVISLKEGKSITDHEIIRYCREYLANYKLPKQIIFIDSLPKTATGRVQKGKLAKLRYSNITPFDKQS